MRPPLRSGLILVVGMLPLLAGACATMDATSVVPARELGEASGRPRIDEVRDLGGADIPEVGSLRPAASDGVAVVGETLWIRGDGFGRQPTVSLGGRALAVVSRTGDGGILGRVPVGTPPGRQALVVSQENGQAERALEVRRLGAVLVPDRVVWLQMTEEGPRPLDGTPLPGARQLQLSADARAAYVLDGQGTLHVFELPAAGAPRRVHQLALGPGVEALFAASTAHRLIAVRKADLLVFDTSAPLRPVREPDRALPAELAREEVLRVAASPDGRRLALAVTRGNRVVLLEVSRLRATPAAAPADTRPVEVALAPRLLAPVIIDVAFAPDGETLWALTGSSARNRTLGPQPTTLHALRIEQGLPGGPAVGLTPARTLTLELVGAPVGLGTGRSLPLASGSAVRLPPEKATVFLAAASPSGDGAAIFAVGAEDSARALVLEPGARAAGRTDVTPDGRWVLGVFGDRAGELRLVSAPADGRPGQARSLPLGGGAPAGGGTTLAVVDLRLQP